MLPRLQFPFIFSKIIFSLLRRKKATGAYQNAAEKKKWL